MWCYQLPVDIEMIIFVTNYASIFTFLLYNFASIFCKFALEEIIFPFICPKMYIFTDCILKGLEMCHGSFVNCKTKLLLMFSMKTDCDSKALVLTLNILRL